MKKIFLFLSVLLAASTISAQKEQVVRVVNDDWQHLTVEFVPGALQISKISLCGETFSNLSIEGYEQSLSNYGNPSLPTFSRLIEVP